MAKQEKIPEAEQALGNADRMDARKRELDAQSAPNRSWLYRNINPVLGIMVVLLSYTFFVYVLQFDFEAHKEKKDVVIYLLGAVSSIVTMVVGYFFGSSKGSSDKQNIITSQMRRKPPE